MRLKIEREALKKEEDAASRDRLGKLEKELAELEERSDAMTQRWEAEKGKVVESQKLKEELDKARTEVELAQRRGDLGRASELIYGVIPQLEKKLAAAGDGEARLVNEAVTEEGIAAVVSRWTGIPVEKMLEGERAKLIKHGGPAAPAGGRPAGGAGGGQQGGAPGAGRAAGPEPADRQLPVPRARPASARPSW